MNGTELAALLRALLDAGGLKRAVCSRPLDKTVKKTDLRPVMMKNGLFMQVTTHFAGGKVRHENHPADSAPEAAVRVFSDGFKQMNIIADDCEWQIVKTKDGAYKAIKSTKTNGSQPVSHVAAHDREPERILKQTPTLFLQRLDIMDDRGLVFPRSRAKFRQINRFLEFAGDIVNELGDGPLYVCDLCCGKGYLTFALYHYLVNIRGVDATVVGIDLKADMIDRCNDVARECGYAGLRFERMDIRDFRPDRKADMVVALHACDTATDVALAHAVKWNARAIMAAPCCQHELPAQIDQRSLFNVLKYPIARQRFAQLLTDTLRAQMLDICGYQVGLAEFIEWEDTPKNLLIRAVRRRQPMDAARRGALIDDLNGQLKQFGVSPSLADMLGDRLL